jgi:hypothetical protein
MTPVYVAGALVGWISSLIHPPISNDAQDAADSAAEAVQQPSGSRPAGAARQMLIVRRACLAIRSGTQPDAKALAGLPAGTRDWLMALTKREALLVCLMSDADLATALRGGRVTEFLPIRQDYVAERRLEQMRITSDGATEAGTGMRPVAG